MTRFAEPEVIACPHCAARYLRKILLSFNTLWQKRYSDGGIRNGLEDTVINVSRCPNCAGLIENIQDLELAELPAKRRFWEKWLGKAPKYMYLPAPSFNVFVELFSKETQQNMQFNWAVKALQVFNQTYRMYGNERQVDDTQKQQYQTIYQYILQRYSSKASDEMILLCADIYRQVGDFQTSLHLYKRVDKEQFSHIVEPAKSWCEQRITSLMEVGGSNGRIQSHFSSRDVV